MNAFLRASLVVLFGSVVAVQPEQEAERLQSDAVAALSAERYEEARDHLRALTRLRPGDSTVWSNLGYCYRKLNDRSRARGAFENALSADESNTYALIQLGNLSWEDGQMEQAASWYERALRLDRGLEAARSNLEAVRAEILVLERVAVHRSRAAAAFWLTLAMATLVAAISIWWSRRWVRVPSR